MRSWRAGWRRPRTSGSNGRAGGGVPAADGGREAQLSCSAAASGRRPGEPAASAPAAGRAGGLAAGGAPALPDRRLEVQSTRGDGHGTSTRGDEQRDPIHSGEGYNGKFRFPEKKIVKFAKF